MDYGERIAKVETEVDSIKIQLHEIKDEQVRLRVGQDKLRDLMDRGFAELRTSLADIQQENARTTRWLVGLAITYGTAIIGLLAKMSGMF